MNKGKSILLVEDDAITALFEKKQLEDLGYHVHHVCTGEDAITIIFDKKLAIDLILMDIDLGSGIDGTEAGRMIIEQIDLPVVFLSNHTESGIVEKTEKISSYGYVVKNSGITVLNASIKMAFKLFNEKQIVHKKNQELETAYEELQQTNEELENSLLELEESRKLIFETLEYKRSILKASPFPIICIDESDRVLTWNDSAESIFGWNPKEIIGKKIPIVPHEEKVEYETFRRKIFSGESIKNVKITSLNKNGEKINLQLSSAPILSIDNKITGIMSIFQINNYRNIDYK